MCSFEDIVRIWFGGLRILSVKMQQSCQGLIYFEIFKTFNSVLLEYFLLNETTNSKI